jgi:methionyl-tRNA synthetase
VIEQCGLDALRWYFARACRTRVDSDVSVAAICGAHDRDLADRLGNLVQRCTTLAAKLTGGRVPPRADTAAARELGAIGQSLAARVDRALAAFSPDEATAAIVELLDAANRHVDATAPWRLARTDERAAAAALYAPLDAARVAASELSPFVPGVAAVITGRLGDLEPGAELPAGPPPVPRTKSPASGKPSARAHVRVERGSSAATKR